MNDMRAVIVPKSDQINADDLIGGPMTITIREVTIRPGTEQPVSIHFEGDNGKPFKPCKSMARVMVQCWGADANQYVGRSMTLYRDPKVLWGGMAVGGIKISHMTHIDGAQTMALTQTKGSKKPFTVKPLVIARDEGSGESAYVLEIASRMDTETSPAGWLKALEDGVAGATTLRDVIAIRGFVSVEKAEKGAPVHIREQIGKVFQEAEQRLAEHVAKHAPTGADDGWPGPDTNSVTDPQDEAA